MSTYRRWSQAVLAAFLLVFIITAWIVFAPLQVGGQSAYVIVTGNSMEPGFHLGDLVIVRQASVYQVGDIVAYRNAELRRYVFHRIIGQDLDRFILKGDNNTWTDSYRPTQEELVGKLWIHLPGIGKVVQWLRLPINMALMAGALGCIVMTGVLTKQPKYRKNKKKKKAANQTGFIEGLFLGLGFLALASLVLGIYSFTHPLLRTIGNIKYQHMGAFAYSANASPGIYDTEVVRTAEPIFPKLTCSLRLGFAYFLVGQLQDLGGTHRLTAKITEDRSGWQRTIPLESETNFRGNSYATNATLDLCQVEALVEAMEQGTGLHSNSYTLAIIPTVNIAGTFGGQLFQDTFEPHLLFRFDKLHFYLVNDNPNIDPLNPSTAGFLQDPRLEANILSLLGLEFKVSTVRVLSLIGLGLSLCGALALVLFVHNMARHSQESLVQLKYGPMLVNVNGENFEASPRMIDIATIDDLAKLAERNNSMIFHNLQGSTHYYFVNNEGITYRCAVSEEKSGLLIISDMSLKAELQQGFERREFRVYYQPIVSLPDMKIVAVEALLRWQHPQRGLISASEFISVAEATGLIESLDGWMLQVACEHLKGWQKAGRPLELAVNLSDRLLEKDAKFISRVLHNTGVDANTLHIEIPEARLIEKVQTIVPKLQE